MKSNYNLVSEEIIGYFDSFNSNDVLIITRDVWVNEEEESFLGTIRIYSNEKLLIELDVIDAIVMGKLIQEKGSELYDILVEHVVNAAVAREQYKRLESDNGELI